jgi:hypothetical protein
MPTAKAYISIPAAVRRDLTETFEDIGTAMTLLRESATDADSGNAIGSRIVATATLEILSSLEGRFSEMAARLARYSEA